MAIGDIPKFPLAYKPRLEKLTRNLREKKISSREIQNHVFSVLGKVSINAEGIKVKGDFGSFEIEADGFQAIKESINKLMDFLPDFLPRLKGRELYIKKGEEITRIKIGRLLPKRSPGTNQEIETTELPVIELPSAGSKEKDIKIYRLENLVEWVGEGWAELSELIEIGLPLLHLTKKENLDKLGESYPSFWDDVFKRCGV